MYDDKSAYALYLSKKINGGCSGCAESGGCDECNESDDCECCPPGLVEVKGPDGKRIGCLTPNDAQEYQTAVQPICDAGYVAVYKDGETPEFRGCVPAADFPAVNASLNPSA